MTEGACIPARLRQQRKPGLEENIHWYQMGGTGENVQNKARSKLARCSFMWVARPVEAAAGQILLLASDAVAAPCLMLGGFSALPFNLGNLSFEDWV